MSEQAASPTQPVSFRIRPMLSEDVHRAWEIDVICFSLPWPESSFRYDFLHNRNSRMWVAEAQTDEGPIVVGALVVWIVLDEAHVGTISVLPEYRRLGIGKAFMFEMMNTLQEEGVKQVFLEVRESNEAAQRLYHQFGFKPIGVRRKYYSDNREDAIEMQLMLP